MSPLALSVTQAVVVSLIAPLSIGLVRLFKARLQGRRGASPFLPYWTLATLFRKEEIVPSGASWAFRAGPVGTLASTLFLAVAVPTVSLGADPSFANIFVIAGALVLGAVFLVFGAMDAGSAFGGMGSSREMTIAALVEPVLIVSLSAVAVVSGTTSLIGMIGAGATPFLILPVAALLLVALAENARYPVDNPATHLELTMVHEAMILNHSGPSLAMLEYASALKLTILPLLIADVAVPFGVLTASSPLAALPLAIAAALVKLTVLMATLALIESGIAKMRFFRVQEYLSGAFLLAFAGLVLAVIHRAAV